MSPFEGDLPLGSREDWTLFRTLSGISQFTGVAREAIPGLVAKELVDNALDALDGMAARGHPFVPECRFDEIDSGFRVSDNGSGIPGTDEDLAWLFSIARPMLSTKYLRRPARGALGTGLRAVSGAAAATGGEIVLRTRGRVLCLRPGHDGRCGIEGQAEWNGTGTQIDVILPGIDLAGAGRQARLAIAIARAEATGPPVTRSGRIGRRAGTAAPHPIRGGHTSPWWYDEDSFFELIRSMPGEMTVADFVSLFAIQGFGRDDTRVSTLSPDRAGDILSRLREVSARPGLGEFSPLGPLPGCVGHSVAEGEFSIEPHRASGLAAELPFYMEAWAFPVMTKPIMLINKTPSPVPFEAMRSGPYLFIFGSRGSTRARVGRFEGGFLVNLTSPFVPVVTGGKSPDLTLFADTMAQAIEGAATGAARCRRRPARTVQRRQAESTIGDGENSTETDDFNEIIKLYVDRNNSMQNESSSLDLHESAESRGSFETPGVQTCGEPRMSMKDAVLARMDEAAHKAGGGGRYRFSLRQLYYALRPLVGSMTGRVLTYDNFKSIVTDRETAIGRDIPGMYRDPRGMVYHPHTGEEISLGTLAVERYVRPDWTFNKVLYSEKEGFFEILRHDGWPERNDCALLTSKGFASRAARDLLDHLSGTGEEVVFFCIHDADAYGTTIFHALQEGTAARPGRTARIVNLGLEPEEGLAMGLEVEDLPTMPHMRPVGAYVEPEWEVWLQRRRIELNAMDTPTFIGWLDSKFAAHPSGRVIPPDTVLEARAVEAAGARIRSELAERILAAAGLEEQVEAALLKFRAALAGEALEIRNAVSDKLSGGALSWRTALDEIVEETLDRKNF